MEKQNELRRMARLVKANYTDITFKSLAEYLEISEAGFYNWLNGYYELSKSKSHKLECIVIDLLD